MSKTIQQTTDVVLFGITLSKVIKADLADGKFDIIEIAKLVTLYGPAMQAIEGISEVPAELADIDSAEAEQLFGLVRQAFEEDLSDERVLMIVQNAISGVQSFVTAIAQLRNLDTPTIHEA